MSEVKQSVKPQDLPIETARLIAAGPEMLKVLIALSEALYIDDYGNWALKEGFDAGRIDSVIAQATGSANHG